MVMENLLVDFGNGITAYLFPHGDDACIERGHSGLHSPEFDVPVSEFGVSDGGEIGSSRANARHFRVSISHRNKWTRQEILRAFSPGVMRTIQTSRGSMPYYVEAAVSFPDSLFESQFRFAVNLVSPLAYPEGALQTLSASEPAQWTWTQTDYATGTAWVPQANDKDAVDGLCRIAQSFPLVSGDRAGACGPYLTTSAATSVTMAFYRKATAQYNGETPEMSEVISLPSGHAGYVTLTPDTVSTGSEYGMWVCTFDPTRCTAHIDAAAGYTAGLGCVRVGGDWNSGVTGDNSIDWKFRRTIGVTSSTTTTVTFDPDTDVPTPPIVSLVLGANASTLTLTDGTRTTTITGTMVSGKTLIVDSLNHTVTYDGTAHLDWFDRSGDWLMLEPGTTSIVSSVAGTLDVQWRPRRIGLI